MPRKYLPNIAPGEDKPIAALTLDAVKLYHSLIHSSPVAIAVISGKNMEVSVVNKACLELWGAGPEIIGKSLYDTLPHLMEQANDILQNILETGKPFYGNEIPFEVFRNGEKKLSYFDFIWQARLDESGAVEGITAYAADVTERANANQQIQKSQTQLHSLANTMPQVVWMAAADGRVFYYNDRIEMYSGATKLADGNWQWEGIVHPEDIVETGDTWSAAVKNAAAYEQEHRLMMKDGSYHWHLSRAIPQKDEAGNVVIWFGTATDIHQQKTFAEKLEAEVVVRTAELQKAVEDLSNQKKKDERKDEFINIASHELKTPLTIATGFLNLAAAMLQDRKDDDLNLIIQKADTALKRLNNIIGDFLDVNKMQHGKLLLNYSPFNFNEMLVETTDFVRKIFPNRTLLLQGVEGDLTVVGDGERLRHVCSNLLNNAVKYSPAASPVELKAVVNSHEVVVEIKDYGIGIDAANFPLLFNRYFRVKEVAETYQGMGIGLYLSAEIVQKHKGKIWVESEKGRGSSFFFSVPLCQ